MMCIRIFKAFLVAVLLLGAAGLNAQAPENASNAYRDTTFKAGEGLMLKVPLDTASVFNGVFPIDLEGYANLPVLGKLYVNDKSAHEVESYIATNAVQYLRDIHVMATPVIRLTLIGFWQHPGMYYVNSQSTVWEACHIVGGPAGEVNLQKWKVYRGSDPLNIALLDEFSKGTTLRNAGVRSGDIFVIPVPNPQSGFWYWFTQSLTVTGQVATIVTSVLTVYITYLILDGQISRTP